MVTLRNTSIAAHEVSITLPVTDISGGGTVSGSNVEDVITDAVEALSSVAQNSRDNIELAFADYSNEGLHTIPAVYYTKSRLLFTGSTDRGIPTAVKALVASSGPSSAAGGIRIFDATNNKVVAEVSSVSALQYIHEVSTSTLANVSSGAAIWEIQLKGHNDQQLTCYALTVCF